MIRTGEEYRESIRDGRAVWINGERVDDVPAHLAFTPIVDVRVGDRSPVGARSSSIGAPRERAR